MLGVICGLEKSEQIVSLSEKRSHFLKQVFGIEKTPSKSTVDRTLKMVNGEEVAEAIIEIMKLRLFKLGDIISADGKTIKSTIPKGQTHGGLQVLTAYFVESGVVLGQKYIDSKSNEIPALQELLCYINIENKTITADAMHCQKDTCRIIKAKGGSYVLGLKGNHGLLHSQVESYFKIYENTAEIEVFEASAEKHNGRCEQRIFYRIHDISGFETLENWAGIKSIFAVRRIVETKHGTTVEVSYYISSLDASPEKMLYIVRSHWGIESMHWLLDVVFSEDECAYTSENAQKTLNILRKFALLLHKIFIAENNLKTSIKMSMFNCLLDDELLIRVCS
jgi:predicted transposase YbfD/YdcC